MKNKKAPCVEIIAVGSELLTPHFQDSNSLYLTRGLNDLGMGPRFKTIVGDNWDDLVLTLSEAVCCADIIITVGGLGPTRDDRTREAAASVLQRKLIFKKELLEKIRKRFARRKMGMPQINKKQAYTIEGAVILDNRNGTAPGLWIDTGEKHVILLPGPPHEIMPMFDEQVLPRLSKLHAGFAARKVIKTTGMTESRMETLLLGVYSTITSAQITTIAYPGQIEIHLFSRSEDSQKMAEDDVTQASRLIIDKIKDAVFSTSEEELEQVVGGLLRKRKESLAVAESCTGGFLGHRITNVAGSSDYFLEGALTYSNESKIKRLGVPRKTIEKHGAVSSEVARSMAMGIRENTNASYGLAITGIAGPTGGSEEKPVGLVYTALSWKGGVKVEKNLFLGARSEIKFQSSQKALDMLRRHLMQPYESTKEGESNQS
jgi:nicotinamide-nucleotide amidase